MIQSWFETAKGIENSNTDRGQVWASSSVHVHTLHPPTPPHTPPKIALDILWYSETWY